MLHGRVVHPATLGSRLHSHPSAQDKAKFPNSKVVVKGDMVAVAAPTEWEAVQASWSLAKSTKWSEWKGLPGKDKIYSSLREESDWKAAPVTKSRGGEGGCCRRSTSLEENSCCHV